MMKNYCLYFLIFVAGSAVAQAPVINTIAPLNAAPQQTIDINGSGFSATPANLNVWFDHVKGTIVSSTPFSIQVQVPAQARFSNVEVINLSNNLSGKSQLKFLPSYGGTSFDATKISIPFTSSDPTELFDIASGDFDLDGMPDLVATKTNNGATATDMVIYKNTSSAIGTISFTKFDQLSSGTSFLNVSATTANVSAGDLNGDGKPEIVATRVGATRNEVFILRNTNTVAGTLSFASAQKVLLDVGQFAFRVSIRDLNQDGKPELIVSNSFNDLNPNTDSQLYIFPNQSTSSTISFGSPVKLSVTGASTSYGLEVQDLDGDTKPDIIVNQFQTSDLFIFKNQSTGNISFAPAQKITTDPNDAFNNVTSSDLNKDGLLDLVITSTLNNNVQIFINNSTTGNISFQAPQVMPTSQGPWGVDVSDIDGDGDADIIVANKNEAKVNVFRQDASLTFTKLDITTAKPCRNLRVGDYDGDGKPDIAVTSFTNVFSVDIIRNANCVSPVITSPSTTVCNGQTIRLQTTPALGVTFSWSKDGSAFPPSTAEFADVAYADITPPGSGTFTVTATAEGGACAVTSPGFAMTSNTGGAPPNPEIDNNTPCLGSALNLTTPTVADTYKWTGPNNFTSTSAVPVISPVASSNAGIYSLQVTVGPCSSNIVTKQLDVRSVPVLPITASPAATVCAGLTVTLSVSNITGYTYQWNQNAVAVGGQTNSSLSATQEGDYSVVVADAFCSQETAQTTVKMLAAPVVNFSFSSPQCNGVAINFTDQTTVDSRATPVYSWSFGNGTSGTQNPTNTYAAAGSFSPSLTVSYSGVSGCSNSTSKPITINTAVVPAIEAAANPICVSETTSLSIAGTFSLIAWAGDNNLTGSSSSVTVTQPGSYSVNTTDANGCTSIGSIVIDLKPIFTVTVSADTTIKLGEQAKLVASGADSYLWRPGVTLSDSTIAAPVAKPIITTSYKVYAKKAGFCDAIDSVKVTIETGGSLINPPAIFSPNGDHKNDSWNIPDAINYQDGTMTIYDGHGSQVWQQKGCNSSLSCDSNLACCPYWDGTYNGKVVPDGTYFYVFSGPNFKPITGSVLVIK